LSDIYQLLKASSICKEDLATIKNDEFGHLILKKWKDIHPGTEFRCFVKNRNLIAISPRDWPEYHEHFITQKHEIIKDIVSIFKEKIKNTFPIESCKFFQTWFLFSFYYIQMYFLVCFDVIREEKDKVKLMDFSPFYEKYTNSLAFDWKYLNSDEITLSNCDHDESDDPEFRFLVANVGIQPNSKNNYGFPHEMIEMFKSSRECLESLNQLSIEE
jgi:D123